MSYTLIHNVEECKYECHIDGHIAYITYDDQAGKIHLTHTIVPDALAGKGLAKTLLGDVLQLTTYDHKYRKSLLISHLI
jgi:predicted GNAT family acetyltransferase